jgi:hypothetical protein
MDLVVSPPRDRPIACSPFFFVHRRCADALAGGVDHHVFVIMVARQQLENAFENPAIRPSAEALVDDFPVAETPRKITPCRLDTGTIPSRRTTDYPPPSHRHGLRGPAENP